MEFTVSRHADTLVIFFSYNCLSMSQQVSGDTTEICSVAFMSPCHVQGGILRQVRGERFLAISLAPLHPTQRWSE